MNWLIENWAGILTAITSVIAAASAIAALTPTPKDDGAVAKIKGLVNLLALNFGFAKNKEDK